MPFCVRNTYLLSRYDHGWPAVKGLFIYLRLILACMIASSRLAPYRGRVNHRFRPNRTDRVLKQCVFIFSMQTSPPRVRRGIDDLDRWLRRELDNELIDIRAARAPNRPFRFQSGRYGCQMRWAPLTVSCNCTMHPLIACRRIWRLGWICLGGRRT